MSGREYRNIFSAMLDRARALDDNELRRHASVSRNNRHRCCDCFTCACCEIEEERSGAIANRRRQNIN